MKISVKTTDKNYKPVVIKRCIIACWILLGICLVIKLFGGNYFAILCTNERFIAVCNFVDEIIPLKIVIGCISSYISYSLFYLAMLNKKWFSKRELIIVLVGVPIFVIIRYFTSDSIGNVINLLWYKAVDYDMDYIMFKQNEIHECYKEKQKEIGINIC